MAQGQTGNDVVFATDAEALANLTDEQICQGFARCGENGMPMTAENFNGALNTIYQRVANLRLGTLVTNVQLNADIPPAPYPQPPIGAPLANNRTGDTVITRYNDGVCFSVYDEVTGIWATDCYEADDEHHSLATVAGVDIAGNSYEVGDPIVTLVDGTVIAIEFESFVTTDGVTILGNGKVADPLRVPDIYLFNSGDTTTGNLTTATGIDFVVGIDGCLTEVAGFSGCIAWPRANTTRFDYIHTNSIIPQVASLLLEGSSNGNVVMNIKNNGPTDGLYIINRDANDFTSDSATPPDNVLFSVTNNEFTYDGANVVHAGNVDNTIAGDGSTANPFTVSGPNLTNVPFSALTGVPVFILNAANLGGGPVQSFISKTGSTLNFRTFQQSGMATVTQVGNLITIGATVTSNATLSGNGTSASPLGVVWSQGNGNLAVNTDDSINGDGTTGSPLSVEWTEGNGNVQVVSDNTISGTGVTGSPLSVVGANLTNIPYTALTGVPPFLTTVASDNTLNGDGTTANPLTVVGANLTNVPFTSLTGVPAFVFNGANLGGGDANVLIGKTGANLNFRTISGSGTVTVTQAGNVITITGAAAQVVSDNTITGVGTTANPLSVVGANLTNVPFSSLTGVPAYITSVSTASPITGNGTSTPIGFDASAFIAGLNATQIQALCDALYPCIHSKLVDFNTGTGVLSIDCDGDGDPLT